MVCLKAEKARLEEKILSLEDDAGKYGEVLNKVTPILGDLKAAFERMDTAYRMRFISLVFEPNLYHKGGGYRTHHLGNIFRVKN